MNFNFVWIIFRQMIQNINYGCFLVQLMLTQQINCPPQKKNKKKSKKSAACIYCRDMTFYDDFHKLKLLSPEYCSLMGLLSTIISHKKKKKKGFRINLGSLIFLFILILLIKKINTLIMRFIRCTFIALSHTRFFSINFFLL